MHLLLALIAPFALYPQHALAKPSISLDLLAPRVVNGVDNLSITNLVQNTGNETVKLLKDPRGVLSTAPTHTFSFEGKNGPPEFAGRAIAYSPEMIVKRGDKRDFIMLFPGETFEVSHDLAGLYNFTRVGGGDYTLSALNLFPYVDTTGELKMVEATISTVELRIEGRLTSPKLLPKFPTARSLQKRIAFVGCSSTRQSQIVSAASAADNYVSSSITYLASITSGTTRYTTWFGAYTTTRSTLVRSTFAKLAGDATSTTYDCSTCTDPDIVAYGYPSEPGKLYLCPGFWTLPATGIGSQAATIIHEQLRFTVNGGLNDYVYGQTACKALAVSNPGIVVINAESYVYFAINDPPLP